jgi:streptogramin lyase
VPKRTSKVAARTVLVMGTCAALAVIAGCGGGTSKATPTSSPSPPLPTGVISSLAMSPGPISLSSAFGSVWAPAHRADYVDRIDPRTDRVIARINVHQDSCSPVFPTPTLLLVSACGDGTSSPIINPKTNRVVGSIPGYVVDYAYGSAWFSDASFIGLQQIDVATHRRVATTKVFVGTVVSAAGKLWDAEYGPNDGIWYGDIAEIDPHSHRVVRKVKVPDPGPYPNLVYAFGDLWLQGGGKPYFFRIDPVSGRVTRFRIPDYQPNTDLEGGDIVAGDGSIWLQTSPARIGRFDPHTVKLVGGYPADGHAGGSWPLPAYGSLWVSNFDSSTIWRDRLGS